MKKLQGLAIAAALCMSIFAFGQDTQSGQAGQKGWGQGHGRGEGMSPDAQLQHMSEALNLTDDQKTRIKPILEDSSKQVQQLRGDTSLSQQDRRAKMQQIHESTMSQIKPILTSDQQKKLESMHERGGRGGHDHGEGSGQGPSPQ
jgi:Spy/CpxP family protein refolding chaperone